MNKNSIKYDYYDQIIVFQNAVIDYYSFLQLYTDNKFSFLKFDDKKNKYVEINKPIYAFFGVIAKINIENINYEIYYGDKEFLIIPRLRVNNNLIGLWEILSANEKNYSQLKDCQFVMESNQIQNIVKRQADAFHDNIEIIVSINDKIINKIMNKRDETRNV